MLHHMKQHLTPEVAKTHFKSGKSRPSGSKLIIPSTLLVIVLGIMEQYGFMVILLLLTIIHEKFYNKSAHAEMQQLKSLPTITEDICVGKRIDVSYSDDDVTEDHLLRLARSGESSCFATADSGLSTSYDHAYIGQKFYVASWSESKHESVFYAQDYWRLEALTPEEQRQAAELEVTAIAELTQDMDHALVEEIMAKYNARSTKKLVAAETRPEEMTVAERIAVQHFDRCLPAAIEYVLTHHDGDSKNNFIELLNHKELMLSRYLDKEMTEAAEKAAKKKRRWFSR